MIYRYSSSLPSRTDPIVTLSDTGRFSTGPNRENGQRIYVTLAVISPIGTVPNELLSLEWNASSPSTQQCPLGTYTYACHFNNRFALAFVKSHSRHHCTVPGLSRFLNGITVSPSNAIIRFVIVHFGFVGDLVLFCYLRVFR